MTWHSTSSCLCLTLIRLCGYRCFNHSAGLMRQEVGRIGLSRVFKAKHVGTNWKRHCVIWTRRALQSNGGHWLDNGSIFFSILFFWEVINNKSKLGGFIFPRWDFWHISSMDIVKEKDKRSILCVCHQHDVRLSISLFEWLWLVKTALIWRNSTVLIISMHWYCLSTIVVNIYKNTGQWSPKCTVPD